MRAKWWVEEGKRGIKEGKNYNDKLFNILTSWGMNANNERRQRMPEFKNAKSLQEKIDALDKAYSDGRLDTDEYNKMLSAVESQARILEIDEQQKKLEEIEEAKNSGH